MAKKNKSASRQRDSGLLIHVTSLPGPYGIGDLGPQAFALVDGLSEARQSWWQVLPLSPPGAGNSPYQSFSAIAGNPDLISPAALVDVGLLSRRDVAGERFPANRVDFPAVRRFKSRLLSAAWMAFSDGGSTLRTAFSRFQSENADWLEDYALFMALRETQGDMSFTDWPRELVLRNPTAMIEARERLTDSIGQQKFVQFLFFRQLDALRKYARGKGVGLIGDLPIFVSPDSADVWANPHLFQLDAHRRPKAVAGVPPDYFSKTGQRWGNPLYDWRAMAKEGYQWWLNRVRATLKQVDVVRIDHFRGFAAYWRIPGNMPTAEKGRWVKAPGAELFAFLREKLGGLPFIAEDLGVITPDVEKLRDEAALPGMRVLQFAFGSGPDNPFLPHNYVRNSVVYTGTHDNDTTLGWFTALAQGEQKSVVNFTGGARKDIVWDLIRLAWSSVADRAIAPMQDILELGSKARMNVPGNATDNWAWRMKEDAFDKKRQHRLAELTQTYGRAPGTK